MSKEELVILHGWMSQLEMVFQHHEDNEGIESCHLISEKIETMVENWPTK